MDPLFVTNYLRNLLARMSQSGWRPFFGWGGGSILLLALKFAYIDAPLRGLVLGGDYYMGLNTVLGIFIGAFVARGVEKHLERQTPAPGGGLVNPAAIQ